MESEPPTYEKATLIDHWDLIAPYISSSDLCSAALVCSRWHLTFVPHLWGHPASHFGVENDHVYVALTRFKRTLHTARLFVRSLTHTLHLPPAHAEIYDGPHADWLRNLLERLPNLQSLIVRGLPFFDHSALQAVKYAKPNETNYELPSGRFELSAPSGNTLRGPLTNSSSFSLRLLDASRCSNVTANGLAQAIHRFENLLYLDLSFTYSARDPIVLAALRHLSGLQVLKLRGVHLPDEGLLTLAQAIGFRVRSLDVRDNLVTDRGVRILLSYCFTLSNATSRTEEAVPIGSRSPALLPYLGTEMLEIYQGEEFEGYLRHAFTDSFVKRLAIEDAPAGGITHLYIAGNRMSAEGASALVRSGRLHVLDLASVMSDINLHASFVDKSESKPGITLPGVEKLVPIFSRYARDTLTFLRIDHGIITKDLPNGCQDDIVQGRVELADTALAAVPPNATELDSTSVPSGASELPTTRTPPVELVGDPVHVLVSPATNQHPHGSVQDECLANGCRRGSAFAPEVVESPSSYSNSFNLLSPESVRDDETTIDGFPNLVLSSRSLPRANSEIGRSRTYSSLVTERKARIGAHFSGHHNLHPAILPHIDTLVLTDVPPFSAGRELSDLLIYFIKQCSEEGWLAKRHAKLDYATPPGRKGQASALKYSANKVFALKRLILELAPEQDLRSHGRSKTWEHNAAKSMTGDRDSESFWSAAETDFSFFGEGEECGLPSLEPGRFAPHTTGLDEKEVSSSNREPDAHAVARSESLVTLKFDTVALLSAFRKERKLAHLRNLAAGATDPETEGYWEGIVQVIRPSSGMRSDEEVDYYGNRFIGGYLYQ